jgi:hypothetical protein
MRCWSQGLLTISHSKCLKRGLLKEFWGLFDLNPPLDRIAINKDIWQTGLAGLAKLIKNTKKIGIFFFITLQNLF